MNAAEVKIPRFENIEAFIPQGEYAISEDFLFRALTQLAEDLHSIQNGIPYEATGVIERKLAQLPTVLHFQNGSRQLVGDSKMLADQNLTPVGSFAHLKLSGVMRTTDGWYTRGIDSLTQDIYNAYANRNITGILLEGDSGGGDGKAGQKLQSALTDAAIPVVVWGHELGSAAIMGTLPATEIIASSDMSKFGSVGTFVTIDNWMTKWYKQYYTDIYADKSPNKNKASRDLQEGNLETLKTSLNVYNEAFHTEVKKFRDLTGSKQQIDHTLSGEIFYAQEAKKRGLIDGVGTMQFALQRLESYASMPKPDFQKLLKRG